ncbi:MAG: TetR family transcriptional regulator [Bdellovibrionales bacterium]
MVRRTKDEAEQTRNAILDAAEKVFYAHGVVRTSLEQIAAAAKVTRGAVYWHFKDKIELCQAMFERVFLPQEDMLERLATSPSASPLTDLRSACLESLSLLAKDKRRQRVVTILMFRCEYVEQMADAMKRRRECKDRMLQRCKRLFEQANNQNELRPGWPPHLAATTLHALMGGLIMSGLEGRKVFDLRTTAPSCLNAFFASISSKNPD